MAVRLTLALLLLFTAAGCDAGVTLVVQLRTDLVPGRELARIETDVEVGGVVQTTWVTPTADADEETLFRAAELDGLAPDRARPITLRLFGPDGRELATLRSLANNRESRVVTLTFTRNCLGVECADDERCLDAQCVDARCLTGVEPECAGGCDCAPLSECDDARCVEGACLHRANDAVCEGVCAPEVGCEAAMTDAGPPPMDAGLGDAGPIDAGPRDAGIDSGPGDSGPGDSGLRDSGLRDSGIDSGPSDSGVSVCRATPTSCDYVLQDCGGGQGCFPITSGGRVNARCRTSGSGRGGAACSGHADCQPGFLCNDGECTPLCCPGEGRTSCPGSRRCEPMVDGYAGLCLRNRDCDPLDQTGCVPGRACYYRDMTRSTVDCEPPGAGTDGDACTDSSDCAPRFVCTGRCRRHCDNGGCPSGYRCSDAPGLPYGECYPMECDPIAQTDCAPTESCYPTGSQTASCLVPVDSRSEGQTCTYVNECAAGLVCSGGRCRRTCRPGSGGCPAGTSCVAFAGPTPREYGACQ